MEIEARLRYMKPYLKKNPKYLLYNICTPIYTQTYIRTYIQIAERLSEVILKHPQAPIACAQWPLESLPLVVSTPRGRGMAEAVVEELEQAQNLFISCSQLRTILSPNQTFGHAQKLL